MSSANLFQRHCEKCTKEIPYLADKCPHCTADISGTNGDEHIIIGAFYIFSSWKNFKEYFLIPFSILLTIGFTVFIIGYLIDGIPFGLELTSVSVLIVGFYFMFKAAMNAGK